MLCFFNRWSSLHPSNTWMYPSTTLWRSNSSWILLWDIQLWWQDFPTKKTFPVFQNSILSTLYLQLLAKHLLIGSRKKSRKETTKFQSTKDCSLRLMRRLPMLLLLQPPFLSMCSFINSYKFRSLLGLNHILTLKLILTFLLYIDPEELVHKWWSWEPKEDVPRPRLPRTEKKQRSSSSKSRLPSLKLQSFRINLQQRIKKQSKIQLLTKFL